MLDEDVLCQVVKHQDGVPVLREDKIITRPGGAGNVLRMCQALGIMARLCSNDPRLILKRRLMVNGKMLVRYDTEKVIPQNFDDSMYQSVISDFKPDGIIIADHGKGFIGKGLKNTLPIDVPIFIDPCTITPLLQGNNITWIGSQEEMPTGVSGRIIIKRGSEGLDFLDGSESWHTDSNCTDCIDDLGAGDQFIVCLAIARLEGMNWLDAVHRANKAAGEQCRKVGIQPLTRF